MSAFPGRDDVVVHTLTTIPHIFVFRIPPAGSSTGHRAADWDKQQVWSGRLTVQSKGKACSIKLLEPDGTAFAQCPVQEGAVEKVTDSSRYFVLRIVEPKSGKHAFIGIGFQDRSEAFDFNVALQDWDKYKDGGVDETAPLPAYTGPTKDYTLKAGQTIKVNLAKKKKPAKAKTASSGGLSLGAPPPSSKGRTRRARGATKPASGSKPAAAAAAAAAKPAASDGGGLMGLDFGSAAPAPAAPAAPAMPGWSDFGDMAAAVPDAAPAAPQSGGGGDWVGF